MKQLLISFFLSLWYSSLLANQLDVKIIQETHRLQQQDSRQFEQLRQKQQKEWLINHTFQGESEQSEVEDYALVCLPYRGIRFEGFHLINPYPFAPGSGECINEARLNQLSRDITSAYLSQGYIHNPFYFEDEQSGVLVMKVNEGKVTQMTTNSNKLNLNMLFPNMMHQPLQITILDQGLDQANRMNGSHVSVDVHPDSAGNIALEFVNQEKSNITGFIGLSNDASKKYHYWKGKFGVQLDNPLGLSDTFYISGNHTLHSLNQNVSRAISFYHHIPYGAFSWNSYFSLSQFKMKTPLIYREISQHGRTIQIGGQSEYVFHRGKNHIATLLLQLEHINSHSRIEDVILGLQSPRLTTIQANINHLQLLENGSIIVNLSYEKGMKWWHADRNKGRDQPEGQFNKWNGDVQFIYYHQFNAQNFRQSHRLLGQYSQNYLAGIKQSELTGDNAVRGFSQYFQLAEKSLILQNTLAWSFSQNTWLFEPYLGMDFGIQKTVMDNSHAQKALGYVVGMKIAQNNWHIQTEWGRGRLFTGKHEPIMNDHNIRLNSSWVF